MSDESTVAEQPIRGGNGRPVPFLRFFAYYVAILAVAAALVAAVPAVRQAFLAPIGTPGASGAELLTSPERVIGENVPTIMRALTTALVVVGTLALVLPVAWVYMFTRQLRYDRSLVQSIIILPLVVSGIVIVVKNSLALAFSLAGIVAAVRFRNTLKDPKDAVYIFLAIGLGLSAGVQALDVALVMSLAFNLVVLTLWKYNIGAIYSGASRSGSMLSIGNQRLLEAQTSEHRRDIKRRLLEEADGMKTDGILLIHTYEPEAARRAAEVSLSGIAKEWKVIEPVRSNNGHYTLEFIVRMRKKGDPMDVLGELDDRWGSRIAAAEYLPFNLRE